MPADKQTHKGNRRQFLKITGLAGLAAGVGLSIRWAQLDKRLYSVSETRLVMGSIANLTVIGPDREVARQAVEAAFARMETLENVFSLFRPNSQISHLNRFGQLTDVHPSLREVVTKAIAYGDLTGGIFDVTVEPLLALYRTGARTGTMPSALEIARARTLVDYRRIVLDKDGIQFAQSGMALTLDGIAKGYIIDHGAAALKAHGFDNVLVEVGGDMHAHGQSADRLWQIGIQSPDGNGIVAVALLDDQAMATSGDYMNTFDTIRQLHHILDPYSGNSPPELSSVSVIAPTACDADALSTSVLVLGPEAGLALIKDLPDIEAYLITKNNEVQHSQNFSLI